MNLQNFSPVRHLPPYRRWDIEAQRDGNRYAVTVTSPGGTEHALPPVARFADVRDTAVAWIDAHLDDGVVLQLARIRSLPGKPLNTAAKSHIIHSDGGAALCSEKLPSEYYRFYELPGGAELRKLHMEAIGCEGCWEAYDGHGR